MLRVRSAGLYMLFLCLIYTNISIASTIEQNNDGSTLRKQENGIVKVTEENGKKHKVYFYKKTPYALCSKALCTWKKGKRATCFCPVIYPSKLDNSDSWMGASLSPYDSERTTSTYNKNGKMNTVVSTFSLANIISVGKISACPAKGNLEYSWADCFGVRCDVTQNPSVAECKCPVKQSKDYISMGVKSENLCFTGSPDGKNYSYGWSAEALEMGARNQDILMSFYKKYFPGSPPTKISFKK
ncbi:hypothetical protein [Francisella sp. SYW-9]|uniref:hypothetical protein n=1 Tax=Francisella sp. SYW-9 TaxID=2610888 RepID=UPI00123CF511|nr:hypothetical protein [Francisella sp. SYW-9]